MPDREPPTRTLARMVAECEAHHGALRRGERVPCIEMEAFAGAERRTMLAVVLCGEGGVAAAVESLRTYGVRAGAVVAGDATGAIVEALTVSGWRQETARGVVRALVGDGAEVRESAGLSGRASWGVAWAGTSGAGALLVREP